MSTQKIVDLFEKMLNRPKAEKYQLAEWTGCHFVLGGGGTVQEFIDTLRLCDFLEDSWQKSLILNLLLLNSTNPEDAEQMLLVFYLYVHMGRHNVSNHQQEVLMWMDKVVQANPARSQIMQTLKPLIK